jgi:hypothetical protein
MTQTKCPVCGCIKFYVKNPDDEYDIIEFECRDGDVHAEADMDGASRKIDENTETFCNACSWHDRFGKIK